MSLTVRYVNCNHTRSQNVRCLCLRQRWTEQQIDRETDKWTDLTLRLGIWGDQYFLFSNHNHQVNYFVAIVLAGYVCAAIIHQTLSWTTGSSMRAEMLMHATAHRSVRAPKQSALKVDSGKKIPCHTRKSNLHQRHDGPMLYQLSYVPSQIYGIRSM